MSTLFPKYCSAPLISIYYDILGDDAHHAQGVEDVRRAFILDGRRSKGPLNGKTGVPEAQDRLPVHFNYYMAALGHENVPCE